MLSVIPLKLEAVNVKNASVAVEPHVAVLAFTGLEKHPVVVLPEMVSAWLATANETTIAAVKNHEDTKLFFI